MDFELNMERLAKKATFCPYAFHAKPFVGLYVNGTQYPAFPRFDSRDPSDKETYAGLLSERTRNGGSLYGGPAEATLMFNRAVCISPRLELFVLSHPLVCDLRSDPYLEKSAAAPATAAANNGEHGNDNEKNGGGGDKSVFNVVAADRVSPTITLAPYRFFPGYSVGREVHAKFCTDRRFAYTSEHVNFFSDARGAANLTQTTVIPTVYVPLPYSDAAVPPSDAYLLFGVHCEGSFAYENLSGVGGHVPLDKHTAARRGVAHLRCQVFLNNDDPNYRLPHTYWHDFDLREWRETRSPPSCGGEPGISKTVLVPLHRSARPLRVGDRFCIALYALPDNYDEDDFAGCDERNCDEQHFDTIRVPVLVCLASIVLTAATYVDVGSIDCSDGHVASYTKPILYTNPNSVPARVHPRAVDLSHRQRLRLLCLQTRPRNSNSNNNNNNNNNKEKTDQDPHRHAAPAETFSLASNLLQTGFDVQPALPRAARYPAAAPAKRSRSFSL